MPAASLVRLDERTVAVRGPAFPMPPAYLEGIYGVFITPWLYDAPDETVTIISLSDYSLVSLDKNGNGLAWFTRPEAKAYISRLLEDPQNKAKALELLKS